jgi:hypothetical protein
MRMLELFPWVHRQNSFLFNILRWVLLLSFCELGLFFIQVIRLTDTSCDLGWNFCWIPFTITNFVGTRISLSAIVRSWWLFSQLLNDLLSCRCSTLVFLFRFHLHSNQLLQLIRYFKVKSKKIFLFLYFPLLFYTLNLLFWWVRILKTSPLLL